MDHTYVDEKSLKTLEDYVVFLVSGMLTIKTLQNVQVRAIELGILKEDLGDMANAIAWDLRKLIKLYKDHTEAVLELIPGEFTAESIIEILKKRELTKARSMTRKQKV